MPSGDVKIAIEAMAIEILSLPMNSIVIFHSYVKLPEGTGNGNGMRMGYSMVLIGIFRKI